jgi:hypothetical protein
MSGQAICPPLFRVNPNLRFEFDKRSQFFIRSHNETLSVVAMSNAQPQVHSPD